MARDVDELFGDEDAATARTTPAIALAISGVIVAVIGMTCLAAPGGVLVLIGLWWIDRELERVENGYLAPDQRPAVERARTIVFISLGVVILLFVTQLFLYCGGFYQNLGDGLFLGLRALTPTS